jgi:hypothetical protein
MGQYHEQTIGSITSIVSKDIPKADNITNKGRIQIGRDLLRPTLWNHLRTTPAANVHDSNPHLSPKSTKVGKSTKYHPSPTWISNNMEDELYFPPAQKRKTENHLLYKSRKKEFNLQELVVPGIGSILKRIPKGKSIRFREQKKFVKKA